MDCALYIEEIRHKMSVRNVNSLKMEVYKTRERENVEKQFAMHRTERPHTEKKKIM